MDVESDMQRLDGKVMAADLPQIARRRRKVIAALAVLLGCLVASVLVVGLMRGLEAHRTYVVASSSAGKTGELS